MDVIVSLVFLLNQFSSWSDLYNNTLTLEAVWLYLFPGAEIHSPLSMFLRLLAPVASDLPIGNDCLMGEFFPSTFTSDTLVKLMFSLLLH